jgi:hypothetical protein
MTGEATLVPEINFHTLKTYGGLAAYSHALISRALQVFGDYLLPYESDIFGGLLSLSNTCGETSIALVGNLTEFFVSSILYTDWAIPGLSIHWETGITYSNDQITCKLLPLVEHAASRAFFPFQKLQWPKLLMYGKQIKCF